MAKNTVLLTGSTGFIGQYVLSDMLRQGREVAVIVRPKRQWTAEERLERRIRDWETRLGTSLARPICLSGDIRHPHFGLPTDQVLWLRRNVETMVHLAALVEFSSQGNTIWDTNAAGTENCLDLCRTCRIANLHYMSTAYVCGNRQELIYEDQLELSQEFRNDYEHSKCVAEWAVRESKITDQVTVYRPAVVIGDSRNGFASSFRGFYRLAQFTHLMAQHAQVDADGRWHHPVRLDKLGHEPRNLVPVDWVAQVVGHVLNSSSLHGSTYHIAPSEPVTVAQIESSLRDYFGYYGVDLVGSSSPDGRGRSRAEETFFTYIRQYMPYWDDDPRFDLTNTKAAMIGQTEPRIGVPELIRMIDFAVRNQFGKRTRRLSPVLG